MSFHHDSAAHLGVKPDDSQQRDLRIRDELLDCHKAASDDPMEATHLHVPIPMWNDRVGRQVDTTGCRNAAVDLVSKCCPQPPTAHRGESTPRLHQSRQGHTPPLLCTLWSLWFLSGEICTLLFKSVLSQATYTLLIERCKACCVDCIAW
jgi:hypothetical protein